VVVMDPDEEEPRGVVVVVVVVGFIASSSSSSSTSSPRCTLQQAWSNPFKVGNSITNALSLVTLVVLVVLLMLLLAVLFVGVRPVMASSWAQADAMARCNSRREDAAFLFSSFFSTPSSSEKVEGQIKSRFICSSYSIFISNSFASVVVAGDDDGDPTN
jgi:hypothetical protein